MTTREDLQDRRRVPGSMEVTIRDVNTTPTPRREAELKVVDENGKPLEVVLWEKHDVSGDWEPGATYELSGGRSRRHPDTTGLDVVINSNDAFSLERVEQDDSVTRLLLMGDTHVGYRHRSRSKKPRWAYSVNAVDSLRRALAIAEEYAVDAIVHAGDVFDHNPRESDCINVVEALAKPVDRGIPFYYVLGNHDTGEGAATLREFAKTTRSQLRLGTDPTSVGDPTVNLFGIDHTQQNLPNGGLSTSISTAFNHNVLVLHEKPYPVVNDSGASIYDNGADVGAFLDSVSVAVDLVVTGHQHVAKRGRVPDYDVPVVVTGPPNQISSYEEDNQPSV